MRALVLGSGGQLGRDMVRALGGHGHAVRPYTHAELDITDEAAVRSAVEAERPDVVVNCAAYTHVDDAEGELREAMKANAEAAGAVARAADFAGAAVLYPSSDYVFDGLSSEPYVESSPPRPVSVYGQSKLAGEHETARACERHWIVRSSWLFGVGGRNFVETMLRFAAEHGEVVVVKDQFGCPTYTGHLADALAGLVATDAYGIHHIAGRGACSWYAFAREIFRQAEVGCHVHPTTTDQLGRPAPRPPYAALVTERADTPVLPPWEEGLAAYLAERRAAAEAAPA